MITRTPGAMIGACLALPLAGITLPMHAASPQCASAPMNGTFIYGPGYAPATAAEQVQADRMIAGVNRMYRQMAAEMNAMQQQMAALAAMPIPSPQQIVRAALGPDTWTAVQPGAGIVFTSVSNSKGSCSQTITYSYTRHGGRSIVHVSQTGNACGAVHVNGMAPVQAGAKVPRPVAPRFVPGSRHQQLIEADDRSASRAG